MQSDATIHEAARAQTTAAAARRPQGRANGARGRTRARGAHAVVALLLLLLLPLGLVHRSSAGACRYDHRPAGAADASDAAGAASAGHERTVAGEQHDHRGSAVALAGAAPGACGPAILVERPAAARDARYRSALPEWRALSPLALAPPPPAPPPRLG